MRYGKHRVLAQLERLIIVTAAVLIAGSAAAQKPSPAQISAVRKACRADYQAHCAEVPTGGRAALACLQKNMASLSPSCQTAVSAAVAGASPQVAPSPPAATAPAAAGAPTGGDAATPASSGTQAPVAAPATPAAPAAAPGQPTKAQANRIRAACRADFQANCAGVKPGGAAALECLQGHAAALSAGCQQAVAAISNNTSAPAGAATQAPAEREQRQVIRSPRQELAIIRFACGPDYRSYCRGLPPGGGRIIDCLKENGANLSPRCQRALSSLRAAP